MPDSSEDELLEKQPPPKVKKLPTPASESPRKSRMGPKKSALAQVSASQDEDETMNDTDLMPTTKGKTHSKNQNRPKLLKTSPNF